MFLKKKVSEGCGNPAKVIRQVRAESNILVSTKPQGEILLHFTKTNKQKICLALQCKARKTKQNKKWWWGQLSLKLDRGSELAILDKQTLAWGVVKSSSTISRGHVNYCPDPPGFHPSLKPRLRKSSCP